VNVLTKQPAEQLKRELAVPGAGPIAAIASVTAVSRQLVAGSAALGVSGSLTAGLLFVDLSGGTDGERYLVTARVTTAAGELREAELEVAVVDGAWAMPDGGAPYLSIKDFVDRFGLDEVVRMTDGGDGRIDRALLVGALAAVQAITDAYLGTRFAVPLGPSPSGVPEIVKTAIGDMARARLYPRGAPEGVSEAAKAALKILERISEGKLAMPTLQPAAAAPSSAAPILVSPGERLYPRGGWSDY
jgi:phage gp36-like protein